MAPAIGVLEAGALKPRLIYDESKLRKRRIEVVWLSPNQWYQGYRYGQISFDLPWVPLLEGKRFYWVEEMDYSPAACRFLVTDVERPSLDEYDPARDSGPWRYDRRERQHYYNQNLTMEFMFEDEIPLEQLLRTTLVDHHPSMCCLGTHRCQDMASSRWKSGAALICSAIGRDLDVQLLKMTVERKGLEVRSPDLALVAEAIMAKIGKIKLKKTGAIVAGGVRAIAVARSVLQAFANKRDREARLLAELFTSLGELQSATESLLRDSFGLRRVSDVKCD